MATELEKLGTQALQDLLTNITQAKAFVLEQAPDVVREIVLLGRIQATAVTGIAFVLFCVAIPIAIWGHRKHDETNKFSSGYELVSGLGWAVSLTAGLVSLFSLGGLFTVWFAPKLYVIQEIGKLLN